MKISIFLLFLSQQVQPWTAYCWYEYYVKISALNHQKEALQAGFLGSTVLVIAVALSHEKSNALPNFRSSGGQMS